MRFDDFRIAEENKGTGKEAQDGDGQPLSQVLYQTHTGSLCSGNFVCVQEINLSRRRQASQGQEPVKFAEKCTYNAIS